MHQESRTSPERGLLTTIYLREVRPALQEPEIMENGTDFSATDFTAHSLWTALHAVSMELLLLWGQWCQIQQRRGPLKSSQKGNLATCPQAKKWKSYYQRQRAVVRGLGQIVFHFSHFFLKYKLREKMLGRKIVGEWSLTISGPQTHLKIYKAKTQKNIQSPTSTLCKQFQEGP